MGYSRGLPPPKRLGRYVRVITELWTGNNFWVFMKTAD